MLLLYVLLSPGFASALAAGGASLSRFSRQLITNGVPVVVVVNYVGFFLFALSNKQPGSNRDSAIFIAVDVVARIGVFVGLHALIYVLSADWFGSFGGDPVVALRVVGPTLVRSAYFENISGVYLYATLVGALPLYLSVVQSQIAHGTGFAAQLARRVPGRGGPVILALLLMAVSVVVLTTAAALIVRLQSVWG